MTEVIRCNVIGPEGSGKTTLLKRLRNYNDKTTIYTTIPTVGTYVEEIWLGKKIKCVLREFGGCMAPIWASSYEDCHLIMYVIDASNSTQLSTATVLLMDSLRDEKCSTKPVLLLFNKIDVACGSLVAMKWAMRIEELTTKYKLSVVEGSCKTNEGLERILDWIVAHGESLIVK